jgi:putative endonuclease
MTLKIKPEHLKRGQAAEKLAAFFLQQKGMTLIEKNFGCKYGEIDLIMRDATSLVFIEVRLRSNDDFGGAAMSIDPAKQQKLTRTAEYYLQLHGNCACRFDVILMRSTDINTVEWIQNAFLNA